MDVRNCRNCGRLFNYLSGVPLCPHCVRVLDDKFQKVKNYIYEHRDAGIQEVADENDVSVQQLRQWVREEKLQFSEASQVGLACESCGTMIRSGRYCKKCKEKLSNNLNSAYQKPQLQPEQPKKDTNSSARMRFLD